MTESQYIAKSAANHRRGNLSLPLAAAVKYGIAILAEAARQESLWLERTARHSVVWDGEQVIGSAIDLLATRLPGHIVAIQTARRSAVPCL